MKVKCINITGGDASKYLTLGSVYEVKEEIAGDYRLVGINPSFLKTRFEIIVSSDEETTTSIASAITARQEKPCQTCGKNNDVGVSVCWCCGNQPHI
jgi:hypothetical protein